MLRSVIDWWVTTLLKAGGLAVIAGLSVWFVLTINAVYGGGVG